jgi:LysM repeat protein
MPTHHLTTLAARVPAALGRALLPAAALLALALPSASAHVYTTKPGDSLWRIAKQNGLPVSVLADANGRAPGDPLRPGVELKVPPPTTGVAGPNASAGPRSHGSSPFRARRGPPT